MNLSPTTRCILVLLTAVSIVGCKDAKDKTVKASVAAKEAVAKEVAKAEPEVPKETTRPALLRPKPLPKLARLALRNRMQNHGDDMESLLWSTLMLDYESTDGIAARMAGAPILSRPTDADLDTINAMLPPEFFGLQDQLASSIQGLRTAAKAKDDVALATQYGEITQTCIRCHSLYLRFPGPE